jgi:magnesium-transporting ATPase (P-type)
MSSATPAEADLQIPWHALEPEAAARRLGVGLTGLSDTEVAERLRRFGPNRLDPPPPPSRSRILLRQFESPLIYVLLVAAAVALALGETSDAGFICAVLLLNAAIGFANEYRAEREVHALAGLVRTRARVRRGGRSLEIDGEHVVPGDLLLLESGMRVGADVRFVEARGLRIDESVLTGESVPVEKDEAPELPVETVLAERRNMGFAGSMIASGRGLGLVVATATQTEVGCIAAQVGALRREPPPLLRRMERFARRLGAIALVLTAVLAVIGLAWGQPLEEVLLGAIALAVSAIPEGLPVALTVALAVGVSRMARHRVVVRHLPAVEALGSCGVIATDKTGTLTHNELTVERVLAGEREYAVSGRGYLPEGAVTRAGKPALPAEDPRLFRLLRAGCLSNEASLVQCEEGVDQRGRLPWEWSGDPTDVALLALGIKAGLDPGALVQVHEPVQAIPFEPERCYAASHHRRDGGGLVCAKGAAERVIAMCTHELADDGSLRALDRDAALASADAFMGRGFRVLAVADAELPEPLAEGAPAPEPADLVFLGLVGMDDPPRKGVDQSIARCHEAGIHVMMVTGDHATTARAIATRVGLDERDAPALTGREIDELDDEALVRRLSHTSVVARATPSHKLRVVRSVQARGVDVAVTGDGVNDAPALRQANLGVAMGHSGSDVAREAADLVITDDDFSSIVAGVREGRVAYDNVRKVTYLLISTGAGEVLAVTGALALGLPVPFTAVQLLWLNLVTNGIQDVALAFEPAELDVLRRPPRPPREGIFDRLMIERTVLGGLVFGLIGLLCFRGWLADGYTLEQARNLLVQLFVLFEIFHIGNSRSETRSLFRMKPLSNPILLIGTLTALSVHVAALYTPALQSLLDIAPPTRDEWVRLVGFAASIVVVMELHKALRVRWPIPHPGGAATAGLAEARR